MKRCMNGERFLILIDGGFSSTKINSMVGKYLREYNLSTKHSNPPILLKTLW